MWDPTRCLQTKFILCWATRECLKKTVAYASLPWVEWTSWKAWRPQRLGQPAPERPARDVNILKMMGKHCGAFPLLARPVGTLQRQTLLPSCTLTTRASTFFLKRTTTSVFRLLTHLSKTTTNLLLSIYIRFIDIPRLFIMSPTPATLRMTKGSLRSCAVSWHKVSANENILAPNYVTVHQ